MSDTGNCETRDSLGRFKRGIRQSPSTEFKKGEHWRDHQPFREKDYLIKEYVLGGKSTKEIADEFGVTDSTILFWLKKNGIERRSVSDARKLKHWGSSGEENPMHKMTGENSPNWKGGVTPERQRFYSSFVWKRVKKHVWERDSSTCQRCGFNEDTNSIDIHHISPFENKEFRAVLSNLVLLCKKCHGWVHSKKNKSKEFISEYNGE